MRGKHPEKYIPLLTIPIMLAVCIVFWQLMGSGEYTRIEGQDGAWDLQAFPFAGESALLLGDVEYIPNALLSPEEFDAAGEIIKGRPQETCEYATSRQRIFLPGGQTYRLVIRSVDYAERLYINGKWMADVGLPGDSAQTTRPDTAMLSFTVEPVDGEITIVRQAANFVHRDGGWHDGIYIGLPHILRSTPDNNITILTMGCFGALFLVHLTLFFILRSYPANLYFALFCLIWLLRTGVTGVKVFSDLLPGLNWYIKFRIEYLALPFTGALIILMLKELFPGILPLWLRRINYALAAIFSAIFLFAPTYISSWAMVGCYVWLAASILAVILCFLLRFRNPNMAQIISLASTALFLYSGLRDMFYYSGIILPPFGDTDLTRIAMLFFVLCQMTAMFMGTLQAAEQAKATEQRLIAENAALDRMNRMRNDVTANVSHEMRTPLAVMSAYAQLSVEAIRKGHPDEQTTANLEIISTEAKRLADMATDLLQLSVAQESEATKNDFDFGGMLRQTANLCKPMLKRSGNSLVLSIPDDLPPVYGNVGELTQVLWNLLRNAGIHTADGEITVKAVLEDGDIVVSVKDTGDGIAPELLPHIFSRRQDETEIGLAICREIVEDHGGIITAKSEPGQGTSIVFAIPV